MQQADRHRFHASVFEPLRSGPYRSLIQDKAHFTKGPHPLNHFHPQLTRYQWFGLDVVQVVQIWHSHPPEFQHIAKTQCRDQAGACALALQNGIGGHGGGMNHDINLFCTNTILLQQLLNTAATAQTVVLGCGRCLFDKNCTIGAGRHDICERPANINTDAKLSFGQPVGRVSSFGHYGHASELKHLILSMPPSGVQSLFWI